MGAGCGERGWEEGARYPAAQEAGRAGQRLPVLLRMRPKPCRRASSPGAEGGGEPACRVGGAPRQARVWWGGFSEEIVSPLELSFPYPQLECQGGGGEAPLGGETEGLE